MEIIRLKIDGSYGGKKMRKKNINIYQFDELSSISKKTAISLYRGILVDKTNWWEDTMDKFHNDLYNIEGIDIPLETLRFDEMWEPTSASFELCLSTIDIFYILTKGGFKFSSPLSDRICLKYLIGNIYRINWRSCHKDSVDVELHLDINILKYPRINRFVASDIRKATQIIEDWKNETCDILLRQLKDDFDYLTSDEAIAEYLRDNDKEFLENGTEWKE